MSQEQSMIAFVGMVESIDPGYVRMDGKKSSGGGGGGGELYKQGTLFKQRDVFNGWRARKFVLQGTQLSYFMEEGDKEPKKVLEVSGSTISPQKPIMVESVEYFPFMIICSASQVAAGAKSYTLASDNRKATEEWIALLKVAATTPSTAGMGYPTPGKVPAADSDVWDPAAGAELDEPTAGRESAANKGGASYGGAASSLNDLRSGAAAYNDSNFGADANITGPIIPPVNPTVTLREIPPKYLSRVEKAVSLLLLACKPVDDSPTSNWEIMFEKDGLTAYRRPGKLIYVRGDAVLPFSLLSIFDLIVDSSRAGELNPQIISARKPRTFSPNTAVQHLKFKPMWPTAPRDMVNITHWRMLPDGRVVIVSFADAGHDDICPVEAGSVRAELVLGGYVLTPCPSGILDSRTTKVTYVVSSDLKGSIPQAISQLVSRSQPTIVTNILSILENDAKNNKTLRESRGKEATFEELHAVASGSVAFMYSQSDPNGGDGGSQHPSTAHGSSTSKGGQRNKKEDEASGMTKATSTMAPNGSSAASTHSAASTVAQSTASKPGAANKGPGAAASTAKPKSSFLFGIFSYFPNFSQIYAWLATFTFLDFIEGLTPTILLLPVLLYYTMDREQRAVGFVLGLIFCVRYLNRLLLGTPVYRKILSDAAPLVPGRVVVRFPVDLGKLLRYVNLKREETGVDISLTHVAIKAAGQALFDCPYLNGHIIGGQFYLSRTTGVDVSVSTEMDTDSMAVKIEDTEIKPVHVIADELQTATKELRKKVAGVGRWQTHIRDELMSLVPDPLYSTIQSVLTSLGSHYGLSVPILGVKSHPLGVCTIITSPHREESSELDIDIVMIPLQGDDVPPVVITIGGIALQPTLDNDRKISASPVLNMAVSIDSRAVSLSEGRKFCTQFQHHMSNPDGVAKKISSLIGSSSSGSKEEKHEGRSSSSREKRSSSHR